MEENVIPFKNYEEVNNDLKKTINGFTERLKKNDKLERYELLALLLKNMEDIYTSVTLNEKLPIFVRELNVRPIFEAYVYIKFLTENKDEYQMKKMHID
ncbi:hypothetical protein R4B61_07530 (plasmid) [Fructilactobacillus vespulae]|uniref:hypothetical protein n=1 Tax=Fructilactobacillus vespulae TaxID=1249630 RepID=UPI0039B36A50